MPVRGTERIFIPVGRMCVMLCLRMVKVAFPEINIVLVRVAKETAGREIPAGRGIFDHSAQSGNLRLTNAGE
jgi:hypothetical protein